MQNSWTNIDLSSVAAVDANTAWAAGVGGLIVKTLTGVNERVVLTAPRQVQFFLVRT
jgi:hypothetical protein